MQLCGWPGIGSWERLQYWMKEKEERWGSGRGRRGDRAACGEIAKRNKTVSDKVAPQCCGHTSHRWNFSPQWCRGRNVEWETLQHRERGAVQVAAVSTFWGKVKYEYLRKNPSIHFLYLLVAELRSSRALLESIPTGNGQRQGETSKSACSEMCLKKIKGKILSSIHFLIRAEFRLTGPRWSLSSLRKVKMFLDYFQLMKKYICWKAMLQ